MSEVILKSLCPRRAVLLLWLALLPAPLLAQQEVLLNRDQALLLALEEDEELARAALRVEIERGISADLDGAFDSRFDLTVSYQRSQGQLVRAQREFEDDRRNVHRVIIEEFNLINEDLERQLARTDTRPIPNCQDLILVVNGAEVCLSDFQRSNAESFQDFLQTVIAQEDDPEEREILELILQQQLDTLRMTLTNVVIDLRNQIANSEVALEKLGVIPEIQKRYTLQFDARFRKLLRNGVELSGGVILDSVEDNFDGKSLRASLGGKGLPNAFITFLGFEVLAPLRQGLGRRVSQAPLAAARLNTRATLEQWLHRANESALAAALAYWDLVASQERGKLFRKAVQINRELLRLAKGLVEGDELPRSDLALVEARLARSQANLSEARTEILVRRLALADRLGLEVLSMDHAPRAQDSLPRAWAPHRAARLTAAITNQETTLRRFDVAAAAKRREATELLLDGAQRNLRRRLDLNLALGYSGLFESFDKEIYNMDGFRRAFKAKQSGPTGVFRLSFDLPRHNRVARAQLEQARSLRRQSSIIAMDLKRQVDLRRSGVLDSLEKAAREVERRQQAVGYSEATLEAATEQFRMGEESVVDMVLTEEEVTSARLVLLSARAAFVRLKEQLRFELGGLVTEGDEPGLLRLEDPLEAFPGSLRARMTNGRLAKHGSR
ncbi:MAG: TolC family protein [Deltaproteobacteria bacterium]|nr:TolC family protein [Deltaproteobacteria bacterium]